MNLIPPLISGLAVACVLGVTCCPAQAAVVEDLQERLQGVGSEHPRLFLSLREEAGIKAKIETDPLLKAAFEYLRAGAEDAQKRAPIKREKVGKRLLGVSRTCLQRVSYAAFSYRMTGDEACLQSAEREMLAAAAFEDWNPSHFLDVAEMTAALAIGYDWLHNDLSEETRTAIRDAIVEKGLRTSLKGGGWVLTTNNWNQVCHGGLVLGALAVLEDAPELAEHIIARAIQSVPRAMQEYEPHGVYPEGPTYWKYGTTYNVLLIAALESVLGSHFGLAGAKGFMQSPEFYLRSTGPTGQFFNFSDCGVRGGVSPAMHWFAARKQAPALLWYEKEALAKLAEAKFKPGASPDRLLAFLLIWAQPLGDVAAPTPLHWKGDGRAPVALLRTGWDADATFVGIKGGEPSSNHGHMDTGSFVLDAAGVRWAIDLGAQGYHGLESRGLNLWSRTQDSERWTVFRLNNLSHNTLVVDGQLQRVKGHAPIMSFSGDDAAPHTVIDMSVAYKGQLDRAHRGVRLVGKSVLVQDELGALGHKTSVRWGMVTNAEVTLSTNDTATLKQDGRTMTLRVLSPKDVELTTYETENPPREHDDKNPNTRMVGLEVEIAPSAAQTLAVFLDPQEPDADVPALSPLKDW